MRIFHHSQHRSHSSFIILFIVLVIQVSCVSIKPSTVQLSAQVGERISEMEKLHQLAIQRYFDMEKQKIEDFLSKTWEPLFLKNFIGTSQILQLLQNVKKVDDNGKSILKEGISLYLEDKSEADKAATELVNKLTETRKEEDGVVRTILAKYVEDKNLNTAVIHVSSLLGTDEPARIIFDFTEAAHQEMQAQRKEMLAPIEEARAEAVATLSEAYAEMIRGQSTITGRLEAAAKRSGQQDELLDRLGVGKIPAELTDKMISISEKVNEGLSKAQEVANKQKNGDGGDILSAIKDALKK